MRSIVDEGGLGQGPRGEYRDQLRTPDGLRDAGWRKNRILNGCHTLIAAAMSGAPGTGVAGLLLGAGLDAWDGVAPSPPEPSLSALFDPSPTFVPLAPGAVRFLDGAGNPSATPTNRLEVEVELGPGVPPAPGGADSVALREFGLTGTLQGARVLINYVRHGVIHKRATDTLVRTIRLVF